MSPLILLNPNIQKYFVYTKLSLKSEVCPKLNNATQFNVISKGCSILVVRLYLSKTWVLCSNADLLSIP